MTKTYTPLIIEGKIFVVENAPDRVDNYMGGIRIKSDSNYDKELATCTKYETLPEHAPYWKERIGQRVEVEIAQIFLECGGPYAIPPQQKQGDEWDEAGIKYLNEAGVTVLPPQAYKLFFWFKSRYNLTKK